MALERLYFITMDDGPMDHLQQVEAACRAGVRWVQLRMKESADTELRAMAVAAKAITDAFGCMLIIDDRVSIAAEVGAHGVHVGKQDMPVGEARRILGAGKIIGGTANTIEDIREHYKQGADYIGLGPYRYTTTKKKLSPVLGLEGYRKISKMMREEKMGIPVIAIGGIGREDVALLLEAGVHGVAFSGMLVHAEDRGAMVESLKKVKIGKDGVAEIG